MRSLLDLNNYSNNLIEYFDSRDPVIFEIDVAEDQTVQIDENEFHFLPFSLNVLEINDPVSSQPAVTINLSSIPGSSSVEIDLEEIPEPVDVIELSTNVFRITGINTVSIWNAIKDHILIQVPFGVSGTRNYTASWNYLTPDFTPVSIPWTVTANIIPQQKLTVPEPFRFYVQTTEIIPTAEIIVETFNFEPVWTMTITPSVQGVLSAASITGGATFNFNPTTSVITIVGDKSEVNTAMNSLSVTFANVSQNFNFTYSLANSINAQISTQTQQARSQDFIAIKLFNADLQGILDRFRTTTSDLAVVSDSAITAGRILTTSVNLDVLSVMVTDGGKLLETSANFNSSFNQTTIGDRIIFANSDISSEFNLTADANVIESLKLVYSVSTPVSGEIEPLKITVPLGTAPGIVGVPNPTGTPSVKIIWGDGTSTIVNSFQHVDKTYNSPGTYNVAIAPFGSNPDLPIFGGTSTFGTGANHTAKISKLLQVRSWGDFNIKSLAGAFVGWNRGIRGTTDRLTLPSSIPTSVTSLQDTFLNVNWPSNNSNARTINGINSWNVSNVTNMAGTFSGSRVTNNISSWNVSNVTTMRGMFSTSLFNQDISSWNVSNVTDMARMFNNDFIAFVVPFNQDISSWDVSNVTDMEMMFRRNESFNQNLSAWSTGLTAQPFEFSLDANPTFADNANNLKPFLADGTTRINT